MCVNEVTTGSDDTHVTRLFVVHEVREASEQTLYRLSRMVCLNNEIVRFSFPLLPTYFLQLIRFVLCVLTTLYL